jgi:hypothetical protein
MSAGPMAVRYTQGGRRHVSGGWAPEDTPLHLAGMAETGCTDIEVFDGEKWARERFPAGARVIAARKHWGSQVGTVTAAEDGPTWRVTDMGPEVMVRFDDGYLTSWWCSGLERAS